MHKAIVHIGTEKTGSTAIQNYLYKNLNVLGKKHGVFFPFRSVGLISNFRMVLYTKSELDLNLVRLENNSFKSELNVSESYSDWKERISQEHRKVVKKFQRFKKDSVVVYSSEHFHSRVHEEADIKFLKDYLDTMYDEVTILVYTRRQDRLALSAYNSAVQGGFSRDFKFSNIPPTGYYYDYLSLAERWSNVFGKENFEAVIFDPKTPREGDVVKDFEHRIGIDANKVNTDDMLYHRSNERLSHSALRALVCFNLLENTDSRLHGIHKDALRQAMIKEAHNILDDFGPILPARSEAIEFYDRYQERNDSYAEKWLEGVGFSDDFSMYPEEATELPSVESEQIMLDLLNKCLVAHKRTKVA